VPIDCPVTFPNLTDDEMRSIDYRVMANAFATQNELGRLCDEPVYQANLANRLNAIGISASVEVPIAVSFRQFTTRLSLDLVVDERVPYELKAVSELSEEHESQLLNYMLLTNARRGKLINFRTESVKSRFVNAVMDASDRQEFRINATGWEGDAAFEQLVTDLVRDWGTSLELSLYTQAVIECLGGKDNVIRHLPMRSASGFMGSQRFHVVDDQTAFHITMFPDGIKPGHSKHLQKLIQPSPLDRLYWVNIARHELRLQTIRTTG